MLMSLRTKVLLLKLLLLLVLLKLLLLLLLVFPMLVMWSREMLMLVKEVKEA